MAMNIIEVFSSNVRFYRMKLKLSQEALAEKEICTELILVILNVVNVMCLLKIFIT